MFDLETAVNSYLVYNCLEHGLFTEEDFLRYFLTAPFKTHFLPNYRQLVIKTGGHGHYVDGVHFLTKANDQFRLIYHFSGCPDQIRVTPDSEPVPSQNFLTSALKTYQNNKSLAKFIGLIVDKPVELDNDVFVIIITGVTSRSTNLINVLTELGKEAICYILTSVVNCDWFEMIEKYFLIDMTHMILALCQEKKSNYPQYWAKVGPKYEALLKKKQLLPDVKTPGLVLDLFPNFYPELTKGFSAKSWFIYQLPHNLQGYLLGYPIHLSSPTSTELNEALIRLSNQGVTAYVENIDKCHQQFYNTDFGKFFSFTGIAKDDFSTQDTLGESVFCYSPFDVVSIVIDQKRYFFTRPEFDNLVEKGKNHWTNSPLHQNEVQAISTRSAMANELMLPPAVPLQNLLENIDNYVPCVSEDVIYLMSPDQASEKAIAQESLNVLLSFFMQNN